jgi:hypothetical protein
MLASRYQNAGQNHDIKVADRCFENVEQFRYFGTTIRQCLFVASLRLRCLFQPSHRRSLYRLKARPMMPCEPAARVSGRGSRRVAGVAMAHYCDHDSMFITTNYIRSLERFCKHKVSYGEGSLPGSSSPPPCRWPSSGGQGCPRGRSGACHWTNDVRPHLRLKV